MMERTARNRFALVMVLLIITGLLAACGDSAAEPAAPPTAVPPTEAPPTAVPPTAVPPTEVPPTEVPPTEVPPTEPPPPPTETVEPETTAEERGREIFYNGGGYELYKPESACASCHSLDGTVGADKFSGPSLLGVAARAGERVAGLSAEEYLRQSIMEPSTFVTTSYKNRMSNLAAKHLTEEELDDVAAFLLTLTENTVDPADMKPVPEVAIDLAMSVEEGNDTRGRISASSYRCDGCHVDEENDGYGPRFSSTEDLPPIMARGELRIAGDDYEGQATSNQEYILESIFMPAVYRAPGEWADVMPYNYHEYMTDDDLANIMAWLGTFE